MRVLCRILGPYNRWNLISWALAVFVGASSVMLLMTWESRVPPVSVQSVSEYDGVALRGGMLEIHVKLRRSRYCPADIQRMLWRWVDTDHGRLREIVPLSNTSAVAIENGFDDYILAMPLPGSIASGQWYFSTYHHDRCGLLDWLFPERVQRTIDVPVHVADPDEHSPPAVVVNPAPVLIVPGGGK